MKHHELLLRPSASSRWLVGGCHRSVYYDNTMDSPDSPASLRGTTMHEAAQYMLLKEARSNIDLTEEDWLHVEAYCDHVNSRLNAEHNAVLHVEQTMMYSDRLQGTADAIIISDDAIRIIDLKTGKWPVSATNNSQLKIYMAMALRHTKMNPATTTMVVEIYQPEIGVDSCIIDFDEMAELIVEVDKAIEGVSLDKQQTIPTVDNCHFCSGAAVCKTRADQITDEFEDLTDSDEVDLAEALDLLPKLKAWIKSIEDRALREAEAGRIPDGYELGETQTVRGWVDTTIVAETLLSMGFSHEDIWDEKMISPAKAYKLLDGDQYDSISNMIVKPTGKPKLVKKH